MRIHFYGTVKNEDKKRNEDAFYPHGGENLERVALSDGVSDSYAAPIMAKLVVKNFVLPKGVIFRDTPYQWTEGVCRAYTAILDKIIERKPPIHKIIYKKRSSYATLLGLVFDKKTSTVDVVWVGDSCAVYLEEGERRDSVPYKSSAEFTSHTQAISSKASENGFFHSSVFFQNNSKKWSIHPGKTKILCMTDALAAWAFKHEENGSQVWVRLCNISTQDDFETLVISARADSEIKMGHDDTTLLVIDFES